MAKKYKTPKKDVKTTLTGKDGTYLHYEFKADPKQEPMRLDKFLMDRIERFSRSKVQAGITEGYVKVNDQTVKSNYKIKPHDVVTVEWKKANPTDHIIPEDIPIDIRYEDDDLLVVHKRAGMVVHPGVGNRSGTLINAIAWHLNGKAPLFKGEHARPGLVHRIDKYTTGLLVIAKTEEAMTHLSKQFKEHTIQRKYRALVWGDVKDDEGTITGHIGRHPRHRKIFTVHEDGDTGKHAVTHYRVIRRYGYVTLIECQLETGRTHQIRVHMKHIGHPVFNDHQYGGNKIVKGTVFTKYKQFVLNCFKILPHQALHAFSLGFDHPTQDKQVYLEDPLPDYWEACLTKWENYTEGRLNK